MEIYSILCIAFKPDPNWCSYRPRTAKINLTKRTHMFLMNDSDSRNRKYEVWVENVGNYYDSLDEVVEFIYENTRCELTDEERLLISETVKNFDYK